MKAKKIASVLMLIGMFAVVALLSSCEKDVCEDSLQSVERQKHEVTISDGSEIRSTSASTVDVLRTKYTSLFHYYQFANNQRKMACGPTAYMCAANTIAAYNNKQLTVDKSLQDRIGNYTGWGNTTPYKLYNHWNSNRDNFQSYMSCEFARGRTPLPNKENWTSRTKIKEFIENALSQKKLVILPVMINGSNKSLWRNDYTTSGSSESNNYISKRGGVGHYIVIYGLDRQFNKDGFSIGTVYYMDVYEEYGWNSLKTVNYLRLLDSNKAASSSGNYSALWLSDPE